MEFRRPGMEIFLLLVVLFLQCSRSASKPTSDASGNGDPQNDWTGMNSIPGSDESQDNLKLVNENQMYKTRNITYYVDPSKFEEKFSNLGKDEIFGKIQSVFDLWGFYGILFFKRIEVKDEADVIVSFHNPNPTGEDKLGDKQAAHAYVPDPNGKNKKSNAGDIHFNEKVIWQIRGRMDIFSTLKHEVGHSLGFKDNEKKDTIMYSHLKVKTILTLKDKKELFKKYGMKPMNQDQLIENLDEMREEVQRKLHEEEKKSEIYEICNKGIDAVSKTPEKLYIFREKYYWTYSCTGSIEICVIEGEPKKNKDLFTALPEESTRLESASWDAFFDTVTNEFVEIDSLWAFSNGKGYDSNGNNYILTGKNINFEFFFAITGSYLFKFENGTDVHVEIPSYRNLTVEVEEWLNILNQNITRVEEMMNVVGLEDLNLYEVADAFYLKDENAVYFVSKSGDKWLSLNKEGKLTEINVPEWLDCGVDPEVEFAKAEKHVPSYSCLKEIDAATIYQDDLYVFIEKRAWRYSKDEEMWALKEGYPKDINSTFPGWSSLEIDHVDAAWVDGGKLILFVGPDCYTHDGNSFKKEDCQSYGVNVDFEKIDFAVKNGIDSLIKTDTQIIVSRGIITNEIVDFSTLRRQFTAAFMDKEGNGVFLGGEGGYDKYIFGEKDISEFALKC